MNLGAVPACEALPVLQDAAGSGRPALGEVRSRTGSEPSVEACAGRTSRDAGRVGRLPAGLHRGIRAVAAGAGSARPSAQRRRVRVGGLLLERFRSTGRFELELDPCPLIWVGRVGSGTLSCSGPQGARTFGTGEMFWAHCPDAAWFAVLEDLVADLVVLEQVPSGPGEATACAFRGPVSARVAHRWWRTFGYVQEIVTADPQCEPEVVAELERLLSTATRDAFSPDRRPADLDPPHLDPYLQVVQHAVALMEADPAAELTTTDLAAAAGVSRRSVQLAFRRALGTTPMSHLRELRLRRVHQDLHDADPRKGHTVSSVAARWGFTSPGRFAAIHRAAYGTAPSRTLHAAGGPPAAGPGNWAGRAGSLN